MSARHRLGPYKYISQNGKNLSACVLFWGYVDLSVEN